MEGSVGKYDPETDNTKVLDASGSIRIYKTTAGTSKKPTRPFQVLEFTLWINGQPARVLTDTGTIGETLISNKLVTTHNIPYTATKYPLALNLAGKGSQSTANYSIKVIITIGKMKIKDVVIMVMPVSNYNVLLSMDDFISYE